MDGGDDMAWRDVLRQMDWYATHPDQTVGVAIA